MRRSWGHGAQELVAEPFGFRIDLGAPGCLAERQAIDRNGDAIGAGGKQQVLFATLCRIHRGEPDADHAERFPPGEDRLQRESAVSRSEQAELAPLERVTEQHPHGRAEQTHQVSFGRAR